MNIVLGQICRHLFGLSVEETSYARRGFRGATEAMRARLEQVGATFLLGYHAALKRSAGEGLAAELNSVEAELQGFAFEGAAMGLALLDFLTPWRARRIRRFLRGAGNNHAYMVHVGVGWLWARAPFARWRTKKQLDPLLRWLAFDGWGFHEGFFNWHKYVPQGSDAPAALSGYERRVFDQGLGRSLWFVNSGNPELIAGTIEAFALARRGDLWSGVGLAAAYAGIVSVAVLRALHGSCRPYGPYLAQGAAFAAKARQRADNSTGYTDLATQLLCGISAADAAQLCDTTVENLPTNAVQPAFELWRQRIQQYFQQAHQLQTS